MRLISQTRPHIYVYPDWKNAYKDDLKKVKNTNSGNRIQERGGRTKETMENESHITAALIYFVFSSYIIHWYVPCKYYQTIHLIRIYLHNLGIILELHNTVPLNVIRSTCIM